MGLDATIKRADGKPLGPIANVQAAFAVAFPGIVLGRLPSGAEKLQAARQQGIEFPDILREHFEATPAHYGGDYEGPDFSAQCFFGPDELVQQVDAVLYGKTTESEPMFAQLEKSDGWVTTFP